jgi:hypothetical protein
VRRPRDTGPKKEIDKRKGKQEKRDKGGEGISKKKKENRGVSIKIK